MHAVGKFPPAGPQGPVDTAAVLRQPLERRPETPPPPHTAPPTTPTPSGQPQARLSSHRCGDAASPGGSGGGTNPFRASDSLQPAPAAGDSSGESAGAAAAPAAAPAAVSGGAVAVCGRRPGGCETLDTVSGSCDGDSVSSVPPFAPLAHPLFAASLCRCVSLSAGKERGGGGGDVPMRLLCVCVCVCWIQGCVVCVFCPLSSLSARAVRCRNTSAARTPLRSALTDGCRC